MTHEEALIRVLCQGPVPVEAISHVEACDSCRSELPALRQTESDIRRAKPAFQARLDSRAVLQKVLPARAHRRAWPAVAAAALIAGLLGGWSFGRLAHSSPAASLSAQEMALADAPWAPAGDDSTLSLLQAAYPMAERFSAVTAADAGSFIDSE